MGLAWLGMAQAWFVHGLEEQELALGPAGAWHGEWHALPQMLGLLAGALHEAKRIAEGLEVDAARMAANPGTRISRSLGASPAASAAIKSGRCAKLAV
jgi:adenylosuccinate lyase